MGWRLATRKVLPNLWHLRQMPSSNGSLDRNGSGLED